MKNQFYFLSFVKAFVLLVLISTASAASVEMKIAAPTSAEMAVNAPAEISASTIKGRLQNYMNRHQGKGARAWLFESESEVGPDSDELQWQLQQLVSSGQPLQGLESVGVIPLGSGSVELDVKHFPELLPLDVLLLVETPEDVEAYEHALRERGFENQDFDALRAYLKSHDRHRRVFEANEPYVEHFAKLVRSKKSVTTSEAKSHSYRLYRSSNRVNRMWVQGLLNSLRPKAQRVFQSTLEESVVLGGVVIGPDTGVEQGMKQEIAFIRSDAYENAMKKKKQEFSK